MSIALLGFKVASTDNSANVFVGPLKLAFMKVEKDRDSIFKSCGLSIVTIIKEKIYQTS